VCSEHYAMAQITMTQFATANMASGGLALVLEPKATWAQFPAKTEKWIERLKAEVLSAPVISADECLVEVRVAEGKFWMTYDDFQSSIQLEPVEPRFNHIILTLQKALRNEP
jgi:hypothetical protein